MKILKYKNYEGSAEIDDRLECRGKVLFVTDLVTYQAPNPKELQKEFEAAVDDYLETCKALGRQPQKPLKGSFNVRVSPELHQAAFIRAKMDELSMNEVVIQAMTAYLNPDARVEHNHTHTHQHQHQVVVAIGRSGVGTDAMQAFPAKTSVVAWGGAHGLH